MLILLALAILPFFNGLQRGSAKSSPSSPQPRFSHIVIIVMEDEGLQNLCHGSPPPCQGLYSPYMSELANTYGIASQYVSVFHESLPNYIALTGGDTFGCLDTCSVLNSSNIIDRLESAGLTWKAYLEDYSGGCGGTSLGQYEPDHNPFTFYQDIKNNTARCSRIVNAGASDATLLADLDSNVTAPNYLWLTPNLCNDMHDLCNNTPKLQAGDSYLSRLVPQILSSTVFRTTNSTLFITFDEGVGYCPLNSSSEDCVYTVWAGPVAKRAYGSSILYDHYSLLATIEKTWNLNPLTPHDSRASPMTEFFLGGTSTAGSGLSPLVSAIPIGAAAIAAVIFPLFARRRKREQKDRTVLNSP